MNEQITKLYGQKVRVRACGLCFDEQERILMVNHKGLSQGDFWAPPGGGVEFGESLQEALKREFLEETGLVIEPLSFQFCCEIIKPPLHAVEVFFLVNITSGNLTTGHDPELQIIQDVKFLSWKEIENIPLHHIHGIFKKANSVKELKTITGFFRI